MITGLGIKFNNHIKSREAALHIQYIEGLTKKADLYRMSKFISTSPSAKKWRTFDVKVQKMVVNLP